MDTDNLKQPETPREQDADINIPNGENPNFDLLHSIADETANAGKEYGINTIKAGDTTR